MAGWKKIWNAARASVGKPPLNTKDADQSRVWRFELRVGRRQPRDKFDIRGWNDLEASIGDVFEYF